MNGIRKIKRILMVLALVILIAMIGFSYKAFVKKTAEYENKVSRIEDLQKQIAAEDEKTKQLKKQDNSVITDDDIEAIARQELGLIKKDEIVIRPN